ncbi:metal ABC transporter permease [Citricoccus sp. NPDC079358]|uniref:metal ABC transporter permease n=1 Tax=Citricoccus sp. NPDC079358 TaxID=3154653 RepID=UPI00344BC655
MLLPVFSEFSEFSMFSVFSVDWLVEPFALGFQQRALVGGLVAAVMCSVVGVWLVLRGMSFFGDAFVHGVMPGIAAAVLFGFSPYLGAAIAAAAMVGGMQLIYRTTTLKEDTSIGLLFVGMMALGVVLISKSDSYSGSLTAILFGDALGVSWEDIRTQTVMAVVVIVFAVLLYRPLMSLSFSPAKAQSLGMHPKLTHGLLLVLIATAVIGSFQAVGTLLVFGLLVGPPATAALVSRTVPVMITWSVAIAVFSVWCGLTLSYYWGTAGSATMALVPIVLFFLVLAVREAVRRLRRRGSPADPVSSMNEASNGGLDQAVSA